MGGLRGQGEGGILLSWVDVGSASFVPLIVGPATYRWMTLNAIVGEAKDYP